MNSREWAREFDHPYRDIPKAKATHGHLKPTFVKVPPFSTFAVPFNWMLRESQERLDESLAVELPPDEPSPFPSAWVFGRARQEAICDTFFGRLTPGKFARLLLHEERPSAGRGDLTPADRRRPDRLDLEAPAVRLSEELDLSAVGPALYPLDPSGRRGRPPSPLSRLSRADR